MGLVERSEPEMQELTLFLKKYILTKFEYKTVSYSKTLCRDARSMNCAEGNF